MYFLWMLLTYWITGDFKNCITLTFPTCVIYNTSASFSASVSPHLQERAISREYLIPAIFSLSIYNAFLTKTAHSPVRCSLFQDNKVCKENSAFPCHHRLTLSFLKLFRSSMRSRSTLQCQPGVLHIVCFMDHLYLHCHFCSPRSSIRNLPWSLSIQPTWNQYW